jgi:hypothetical protein
MTIEDDDQRVRDALDGMDFPAERDDVIDYATDRAAADDRLLTVLEALPDRMFSTVDDVVISVPDYADQL